MKQSKGKYWFTCVFEDNRIVQTCIPKGWSKAQAEETARESWKWQTAIGIMKEKDPGFKLNPPTSDDPKLVDEYHNKKSVLVELVKTLKAPSIRFFQWERKQK